VSDALASIRDKNLCDPVMDSRGVRHAFSHAIPWYEGQTVMCFGCWCGWEGRKADFDLHMAAVYGEPFAAEVGALAGREG
jgi:hypothetical protein